MKQTLLKESIRFLLASHLLLGGISLQYICKSASAGEVLEEWVARYENTYAWYPTPQQLAVDNQGSSYVIGYTRVNGTGADYLTVKYATDGAMLWTRRYNGQENKDDIASAVTLDRQGNLYVTGYSYYANSRCQLATIKYDTDGNPVWTQKYGYFPSSPGNYDYYYASAIAVDTDGNAYVVGEHLNASGSDFLTVKYDTNGQQLWVRLYRAPGSIPNGALALAIDKQGNVYVLGSTSTGQDYTTVKYDRDGNQLWARVYDGPSHSMDDPSAIAVDDAGNVYVTGRGQTGSFTDYLTLKYDANGNQKWVKRYDGPAGRSDAASALAVDHEGNVYVTGSSMATAIRSDFATVKYDTDGNQKWVALYNGPANVDDLGSSIAIDGSGGIYVTGISGSNTNYTDFDYATVKYGSDGAEEWVMRYAGPANASDMPQTIALDQDRNIYVTGISGGGLATIKYSPIVTIMPGDADGDEDIDRDDIALITAGRNTPATGPEDPRDLDGDGMITALDARKAVLLCTRPRCANE